MWNFAIPYRLKQYIDVIVGFADIRTLVVEPTLSPAAEDKLAAAIAATQEAARRF